MTSLLQDWLNSQRSGPTPPTRAEVLAAFPALRAEVLAKHPDLLARVEALEAKREEDR